MFGLFIVAVGMPLSAFLMSMGQLILLGNWLIEGEWKRKWDVIKSSRILWVISAFYLLHVIGLFWTSDFQYAAKDLRIKLPLFWFPLLFITSRPLEKRQISALLWFFASAVVVATFISTIVWLGYTKRKVLDIRDISIFVSHIRFALMIDLVICFLMYDLFKIKSVKVFILKSILLIWLFIFLGIMQSLTGYLILGAVMIYYFVRFIFEVKNRTWKAVIIVSSLLATVTCVWFVYSEVKKVTGNEKHSERLITTESGGYYYHDESSKETENGNLIWINICREELIQEWPKRSQIDFEGRDKKGNVLNSTLIRYMASKGLNKDSAGLWQLSKEDIKNIENGVSNFLYTNKSGPQKRIYEVLNEYRSYQQGQDPTGHSIMMRLEFWRVGWLIIKDNWLFGVGTGDVQAYYNYQYEKSGSQLKGDWRRRSHNQYMAITIAFGVTGLLVFLLYLFVPVILIKKKHFLFPFFFIISLLSMLTEDTLENQAGVTFFGFFYCLLLLNEKEPNI